jgi:FixJ family two-component response regulator
MRMSDRLFAESCFRHDRAAQVPNTGRLIAIVDDDEAVRNAIKGLMRSVGFTAEVFPSAEDFLSGADVSSVGCLIADVNMPAMSGLDLHQRLSLSGKAFPTVLITAYPSDNIRDRAAQSGVLCYLIKPFDEQDLLNCIVRAFGGGETRDETP